MKDKDIRLEFIDEALYTPLEFVTAIGDLPLQWRDQEAGVEIVIEDVKLRAPIEFDVYAEQEDQVNLGLASPIYDFMTSFETQLHQITVRYTVENEQ